MATQVVRVSNADAGQRVDQWLSRQVTGLSRHRAQQLCAERRVRINGRSARKGQPLNSGDLVEFSFGEIPAAEPELELTVRFERADLVVVSKPAGMPTAPLAAEERGSLVAALLARYPEMHGIGHKPREAGIIHRLDTQTSGLVVAARTPSAFAELIRALQAGELEKRYWAVVARGIPQTGQVDLPLHPDPADRRRVRAAHGAVGYQRQASTGFRVVREGPRYALVEATAHRAFRHQVRAHFAAIGFPLVGDSLYGGALEASLGSRHALQASHVRWAGNARLAPFAVSEELAPDLAALLALGEPEFNRQT